MGLVGDIVTSQQSNTGTFETRITLLYANLYRSIMPWMIDEAMVKFDEQLQLYAVCRITSTPCIVQAFCIPLLCTTLVDITIQQPAYSPAPNYLNAV